MKHWCLLSLILLVFISVANAQVKYTTPECAGLHVDQLIGISNNGVIVGSYYTDTDPLSHPLLISKGKCIPIGQNTILATKSAIAFGVNDQGDISGSYFDGGAFVGPVHGFLLNKSGVLTVLDFPGADNTYGFGINESGTVVGSWSVNDSSGNLLFEHGFVWKNGDFRDVVYAGYYRTQVSAINARGDFVGTGIDPDFIGHPFIYSNGEITPMDLPPSAIGSSPQGINDKGEIAGQFFDESRTLHAFLKLGSVYTTFDVPGAVWTTFAGINNAGEMGGVYWDSNWAMHGFLAEIEK